MTNEERVSKFISEIKDAPAFPTVFPADTVGYAAGLTKREWIATQIACARLQAPLTEALSACGPSTLMLLAVELGVIGADALLNELAKPRETK